MKLNRITIIGILLLLSLSFMVASVNAEATTIDIIVIGEDDVTGYINGTAVNGSVYYYIDGIEVKGEFGDVWSSISSARRLAKDAYSFAGMAYAYAGNAYQLAKNTNDTVVELTFIVENNTHFIYLLRDELVAFENDYLVFKKDTNKSFNTVEYKINQNSGLIKVIENDVNGLEVKDKQLEQNMHLLLIPIFGVLACFGMVIWVFHKQKIYIDNHDKKLEKYIDVQLFLDRQIKVEVKKDGNRRTIR